MMEDHCPSTTHTQSGLKRFKHARLLADQAKEAGCRKVTALQGCQEGKESPSPSGMSDVSPIRLHISRHYGSRSIARPARRMGDPCRQVSWLTVQTPPIRLPDSAAHGPSVALWWRLTAYSCGGSHGFGRSTPAPHSLFFQSFRIGNRQDRYRSRTHGRESSVGSQGANHASTKSRAPIQKHHASGPLLAISRRRPG